MNYPGAVVGVDSTILNAHKEFVAIFGIGGIKDVRGGVGRPKRYAYAYVQRRYVIHTHVTD